MKKQTVFAICIIIAMCILYFLQFNNEQKIAYVEINKLVIGYKGTGPARQNYEKIVKEWQNKMAILNQSLDSLKKVAYNEVKNQNKKNIEIINAKISQRENDIKNYYGLMKEKANEEDQRVTKIIYNELDRYIKEFGKKNNCSLILGASINANIVYADTTYNVTNKILDYINNN
jgi:outer membrane protein